MRLKLMWPVMSLASMLTLPQNGASRESVVATIQLAISELKAQVEQQAQEVNLNALADRVDLAIEDIDALGAGKAEATALAELKAAYEATIDNYLPRGGGVLDGQFVMQKSDIALPSIDFSGQVTTALMRSAGPR